MYLNWCRQDCMVVGFITIAMQSVPITTNVMSSNPTQARCILVYTTLCDKVCQLLVTVQWFSPVDSTNKTDCHNVSEILLKVALNTITLSLYLNYSPCTVNCKGRSGSFEGVVPHQWKN